MNKTKLSNPVRSIAFFLTAIILACTFGFTVDGWQDDNDGENHGGNAVDDNNVDIGDIENGENEDEIPDEPTIYIPEYTDRLTGLEISEIEANARHLAFVFNPDMPLYGISMADVICDIPTEDGMKTICFIRESTELWKIGSITSTRGYVSNIAAFLGGVLVSSGSEDLMAYESCSPLHLVLSAKGGYSYTEQIGNVYTNKDLITSGLYDAGLSDTKPIVYPLPYTHVAFGEELSLDTMDSAREIRISHSEDYLTSLKFNEESGKYSLFSNSLPITEAANGSNIEITNCFVLFADSVTYDNSSGSQMVMDTVGGGKGYYFVNGVVCPISWTSTLGGIMTFYSQSGEKLMIERGSIYISFVRSSRMDKVSFQ